MLVKAVRAHAEKNYNRDGWDFLVECWSDEEILEAIAGCTSAEDAIGAVARIVGALEDHRREIQSTVW